MRTNYDALTRQRRHDHGSTGRFPVDFYPTTARRARRGCSSLAERRARRLSERQLDVLARISDKIGLRR